MPGKHKNSTTAESYSDRIGSGFSSIAFPVDVVAVVMNEGFQTEFLLDKVQVMLGTYGAHLVCISCDIGDFAYLVGCFTKLYIQDFNV